MGRTATWWLGNAVCFYALIKGGNVLAGL